MDRMVQRNVCSPRRAGRREAAGDVNTLLLDKTGTITLGNRQATDLLPCPGSTGRAGRRRPALLAGRRDPRGPLDRVLAKERYGLRGRELWTAPCSSRSPPRRGCRGRPRRPAGAQGGHRRRRGLGQGARRGRARRARPDRGGHRPRRRHAAGGGRRRPRPRRHPPQGRRQRWHARPLRPATPHGHPHRHDHRRQPAHGGRHRQRGRGRRLPRPGHARAEDGADPSRAGRRQADRHDRGRHQRRPGAGPRPTSAWP